MTIFSLTKAIIIIAALFPLAATAQEFCAPKTDYDPNVTCSGQEFYADTPEDLAAYGQSYGLEDGKYKPLRIRFGLSGEQLELRAPCKISFKSGLTHTAASLCIDGRKGVVVGAHSILKASGNVKILAPKGGIGVRGGTFIEAAGLEMASRDQLLLSKGTRTEVAGAVKLESSFEDVRIVAVRIARGSIINAGSLALNAKGKVNIAKNAAVTAGSGDVMIATPGIGVGHRVTLFKETSLSASGNITIDGGNLFSAMRGAKVEAGGDLSIDAKGCRIGAVTLTGADKTGTCLATGEDFNRHPTALFDITPGTGEVPLTVNLDASPSRDLDGSLVGYVWEFSDGSTITGIQATKTFSSPGVERIALTVIDNDGSQAQKRGIVTVLRPAGSPTAIFTYSPVNGDAPLTVTFDGSPSLDPNGNIVKYEWLFDDGTVLEGETQSRTFDTAGTYTVALKVTDDEGLEHQTGESEITVIESNAVPVMAGDQGFQGMQNKSLEFTLSGATDDDGDTLTYMLVNPPGSGTLSGCLENDGDLTCTFTPETDFVGEVIFSYKANDGKQDSETVSVVTLTLMPYNTLPVPDAGADQRAVFGELVALDGSASYDPEGEDLTYSWEIVSRPMLSDILLADAGSPKPEFVADKDGIYTFRLTVGDGKLEASDEITVTVAGENNTAPVLDAITDRSVQVGQELRFTVSGSDTDSHDHLIYTARSMPKGATFIGPRREFRFQPAPDQTGDHKITFMVSDGKETATREVTVTVEPPDADQPTTLSSRVFDGTAMDKGTVIPLSGVKVSVEGSSLVVTSDADGYFSLSNIPAGALIVSLDAAGVTAPDGSLYGNFKGRLKILPNVHNRPYRDYMLPRVDKKGMAMVEPQKETMLHNQDLGVTMMIPANTATQNGTGYTGPISVSMVPVDSAPRELPPNLQPNLLITLQPVNIRFSTPVPITFPNTDNLPPGALVGIISLSERGGFEQVGVGRVTDDGQSIATVSGGIVATTWHAPVIIRPEATGFPFPGNNNRDMDTGCGGNSIVCPSTGVLKEEHYLPRFRDAGRSVSLKMEYKNPMSMERMVFFQQFRRRTLPGNNIIVPPPPVMGLAFAYGGSRPQPTWFSTGNILTEDGTDFKDFLLAKAVDLSGLTTGFHEAEVIRTGAGAAATPGNPRPSQTSESESFPLEVISPDTEFGRGWRFGAIQRIYGKDGAPTHQDERLMLVFGNFNHMVFTRNGDGTYTSPDGDYSTLTTIPAPINGFRRTMKDGMVYAFDSRGLMLASKDRHHRVTRWIYDSLERPESIIHPGKRTSRFAYGADGLIDTITDGAGRVTTFEHKSGYLVKITDPDGSHRLFGYSDKGLMISQEDKNGRVKTYAYDEQGSVIRAFRPDGTRRGFDSAAARLAGSLSDGTKGTLANPIPALVAGEADHLLTDSKGNTGKLRTNRFGAFVRMEDALGGVTTHAYDDDNNITETIDENGNPVARRTWSDIGNLLTSFRNGSGTLTFKYADNPESNFHQPLEITDSKGNVTKFAYDSLGNLTELTYPNGNVVRMNYRKKYLLARVEDVQSGSANIFEYDDDGNVTRVRDAYSRILRTFTYDDAGNILTSTDGTGNVRTFTYDSLNRLLTMTDGDGGVAKITYDTKGNLLTITNQRGKVTTFEYDEMDRWVKWINPNGDTATYDYDENGNLAGRTNPKGDHIAYTHDALDRLVGELHPDGTLLEFEYDPAGNLITASTPEVTNTFIYDDENRIQRARTGGILPEVELFYAYDKNGNLKLLDDTEIHSSAVRFEHDDNNNLVKIMAETPRRFVSEMVFSYDESRRRSGILYPNGVSAVYTYEVFKQNRLRKLTYKSDDTVLSSFKYTHDLNDFLIQIDTVRSGITVNPTQTIAYDKRNQIVSVTRPMGTGTETFTYDSAGNCLQRDGETTDSTFDDDNRLLNDKKFTYEYDANGNRIKQTSIDTGEIKEFSWDYRDRLAKVTIRPDADSDPTITQSYKYDALGRRIEINTNGTIVRRIYDHRNIYFEYDGENTFKAKYVHSDNINEPVRMERPENPYKNERYAVQEFYFHRDRMGNITEITDFDGNVVQRYVYDAFGKVSIFDKDGNPITGDSPKFLQIPYAFTGQEYYHATGLQNHGWRTYDPISGLWLSPDPLGFLSGDIHPYRYVLNNPLNFIDPSGLAVGDWWDVQANYARIEEIAVEERRDNPGRNDLPDAQRHSEWMRRSTEEIGPVTAWVGGVSYEIHEWFGAFATGKERPPLKEIIMDLHNNYEGIRAGVLGHEFVDPSRLRTLPPGADHYQPVCEEP